MVILILLLILAHPLGAQDFYYSDSLGSRMERSTAPDDSRWILRVDTGLEGEERVLFRDQEPYKRWVLMNIVDEDGFRISEKFYFTGSLRSETIYDRNDRILEELLYDSDGSLMTRKSYEYGDDGKLSQISREGNAPEGDESRYTLKYRDEGSLVSLQSDGRDRIEWRSGNFDRQYLDTLYLVEDGISSFLRYEKGRLVSKTIRNEKQILEESRFSYYPGGTLEKALISEADDRRRTERYYDKEERLLVENVYVEDVLFYSLINTIVDGVLVRKQERSSTGRFLWVYEYCEGDANSSELCTVRQYRNGQLLKLTEYLEDQTIENLYRNNEVVMVNIIERVSENGAEGES